MRLLFIVIYCLNCASCSQETTEVVKPEHEYQLSHLTLYNTEGGSWTYVTKAAQATGNKKTVTLHDLHMNAYHHHDANSFTIIAQQGEFLLSQPQGVLRNGITVLLPQNHIAKTEQARLQDNVITSHSNIDISGPSLKATFQGIQIETDKHHIESLGPVNGLFYPRTSTKD